MKKSIVFDGRELQDVEMQENAARDAAMLSFLGQFITDERRQRFEEVLDYRTRTSPLFSKTSSNPIMPAPCCALVTYVASRISISWRIPTTTTLIPT